MAALDVIDETFVLAGRAEVAAAFADPHRVAAALARPRAHRLRRPRRGRDPLVGHRRWVGSAEVWCEPVVLGPGAGSEAGGEEGTLLHWFLRVDPAPGPEGAPARRALRGRSGPAREALRRQRAAKAIAFGLKDALERGRRPGEPAVARARS